MPRSANQKLKILYIYKILFEMTDENVSLNASQIITELERYGISAERKSIYDDIEALRLFGVDINTNEGKGYYIGERLFELSEIKMLIDVIQAAKFMSGKKTSVLSEKLRSLAPISDRRALMRQIVTDNSIKTSNESVYYSIDSIHRAIDEKKKLRFRYHSYDIRKNKIYKNKGQYYFVNPISLIWSDEKYYLVAYDDIAAIIKHYRVDKMESVTECAEEISREVLEIKFDAAQYTKANFHMYSGNIVEVTLQGKEHSIGLIFDKFGKDVFVIPGNDGTFRVSVKVTDTMQFYSWLFGISDVISLVSPKCCVEKYRKLLKNSIENL